MSNHLVISIANWSLFTTGQLEELFQRQVLAVEAETGRDGTGGNLQVEDVIVESEIAYGNVISVEQQLGVSSFSRASL